MASDPAQNATEHAHADLDPRDQGRYRIGAVATMTGISTHALRVWERRYGFPVPQRGAAGERLYPPEQVTRLRLIRRLMNGGLRPNKVVPLPETELRALLPAPAELPADPQHASLLGALKRLDGVGLHG